MTGLSNMQRPGKNAFITVDEYLANEEQSSIRHEYVNGQIFSMSGTTNRHNIIAGNIHSIIRPHVRGSSCRVYISDVKARVESTNCFYYPDVMVSCQSYDRKTVYTNTPTLIVEVLSRSTAAIDRREKMSTYKTLPSLKEYLIVHQSKQRVELHRRTVEGTWEILEFGPSDQIDLTSIPTGPLTMSMSAIYEDVDFGDDGEGSVQESVAEYGTIDASELDW
jgi:Uma2 family endonuclease